MPHPLPEMTHSHPAAIADKTYTIPGADPRFTITRRFTDYAYPQNGNVVRLPTPKFTWFLLVDGLVVDSATRKKTLTAAVRDFGDDYLAEVTAR